MKKTEKRKAKDNFTKTDAWLSVNHLGHFPTFR